MVEMNETRCELKALNDKDNLGLLMTWATLDCEIKALNALNSYGLSMIWKTLGREFKANDSMNKSRLWNT